MTASATPDSPFATRTIAELLDRQGHGDEAAAIRRELAYRAEKSATPVADSRREQLIATLERWLENLRRDPPMSFTSALRSIVDECGGGIGAALMGSDGIAIDQVEATRAGRGARRRRRARATRSPRSASSSAASSTRRARRPTR